MIITVRRKNVINLSTSLPKLYYNINNKRGVSINKLRVCEKLGQKAVKLRLDVKYLEACVELDICPKFLRFKPPNISVYHNLSSVYSIGLKRKIKETRSSLKLAQAKYVNSKQIIFQQLSFFEKQCLVYLLEKHFQNLINNALQSHQKKLYNLWREQRIRSPKCIINLSSKKLTLQEEEVLQFGLDHHILPRKLNLASLKVYAERLFSNIKRKLKIPFFHEDTKDQIKYLFQKFALNAEHQCASKRNQFLHRTLQSLSNNTDIKVCKLDKGRGVAILNSDDYYAKLDNILADKSKFIKINTEQEIHPIIAKENSIRYYVRKYLKGYGDEIIKSLIPSGSNPGKLYGLIKVHKDGNPARPVVSMIGTPEYKLAKFLDSIIKPYIPDSYIIQSSEEFLNKINTFNFNSSNQFLVSFDVKSLFTNVPLSQTIDIIANYIFSSDRNDHPPITKEVFVKLMHLATECMFLFKDELYKQVDGIGMGSPLGCTMANFFLGHLETLIFKDQMSCHPKLYVRYIDDVFAVFDDVNACSSFLNILNSQHDNIKFTIEKSTNTLQFLDVDIKISENTVDTWVWRKPTNTGLFLNFAAICPIKWKSGLVFCMLHRAAKLICSSDWLFFKEVEILKSLFLSNNYPPQFFDKILRKFLALSSHHTQENENSDECETCFFKVPYIDRFCIQTIYKKSV